MPITSKHRKPGGYVTLVANSTGDGVTLNGATQGANATADEVVQEMRISAVWWSIDSAAAWAVRRGSNNVLNLAGSGHHDYQEGGVQVEVDEAQLTSNLNIETSGTGNIIIKLHKVSGE